MPVRPIIHGKDHLPGGADPIPGLCCPPVATASSFPDAIASLATTHAGQLLGYWRLGDGATPFLDTSGYTPAAPAAKFVPSGSPLAMTDSIVGALPPADDDGAVQFPSSTGTIDEFLRAAETGTPRFNLIGAMTVACWVKPLASASTFVGQVVANWPSTAPAFTPCGWRLAVNWPARTPAWTRTNDGFTPTTVTLSGSPLTAGVWAFLVAVYDPTGGMRLFTNGALVGTDSTLFTSLPGANAGPNFGPGFYGGLDEVSLWNVALTPAEIAGLYTSGLPAVIAAAGEVITSDGAGATTWAYPTVNVDGTRYQEILTGTNLTSTNNLDGTVTLAATGGGTFNPATATTWWMPLVDSDGTCVLDGNGALIPTLIGL